MLATILKGERARNVTFTIIETFFTVRSLKRELLALHNEPDKEKQKAKMQHFGEVLSDIVMPDLQTSETESSLEINFLIVNYRQEKALLISYCCLGQPAISLPLY